MTLVRRTAVTCTAMTAALGLLAGPAVADGKPKVIRTKGPTYTYDTAYSKVKTRIRVVLRGHKTVVRLKATGFPKSAVGKTFGIHVHENACGKDPAAAGPHYRNPDAKPGTPLHAKEIWLDIKVRPDGSANSRAKVPWRVGKGDAGSVVIHAKPTAHETGDAGARLTCTDVPF
jgi:superoxide dismutase, Cu-Zn family